MGRRLFALFVACAVLPLASFALYACERVTGELDRQAALRLEAASKEAGMGLLERLLLLDAELRSVAARLEANGGKRAGSSPLVPERVESLQERFAALWLTDREGRPARAVIGEARALPPPDRAERERLEAAGALLRTQTRGAEPPAVLLLRPVRAGRPGEGYVVGRARRAFLWRTVEGAGLEAITVYDASGRILASSLPAEARPPAPRVDAEGAGLSGWSARGEPHVGASWSLFLASRFGAAPWTVLRSEPRSWVHEPVRAFERTFLLVTGLALALVALLSHAWIRRTLRPLQRLREGAERLGSRDLAARVPLEGEDEFAEVARAFNRMAHDLDTHFRSLDRLLEIDQEILAASERSELAALVVQHALSLCECDAALVAVAPTEEGEAAAVFVATAANERPRREAARWTLPEGLGAEVVDRELPEEPGELLATLADVGMRHARVIPLVQGRARLGVLVVARERPPFLPEESTPYVRQLADQTSTALAHLHESERSHQLAYYDALTGLPNRILFYERLQEAILQRRAGNHCAVCLLRVEGFRRVQETLGERAGSELLRAVAERIAAAGSGLDAFRFEGSEFAVLAPELHAAEGARRVARTLLDAFHRPFRSAGEDVVLSARAGVAVHPQDGHSAELLERNARTALNFASEEGPGGYRFYSPAMYERSLERLALESDLRRAIDRDELGLVLHPIVDVESRDLVGAEVLLRWTRAGQPVPPERFIPVAEETGLIGEIGEWVLRNSCGLLADWSAEGLPPIQLHVNVSPHQLRDERLLGLLHELLRDTGLPPDALGLEITENAVTDHGEETLRLLGRIRELGVHLAIDDFGKGYSSMTQLRSLSVHALKIDRSFIERVHAEPADAAVTRAIVAMAHGLGLRVVAEGVAREEHLAFLREERCDEAQGFLFSEPLPPDTFRKRLREAAAEGALAVRAGRLSAPSEPT